MLDDSEYSSVTLSTENMNVNAILVQMGLDWTTDNIELNNPKLYWPALG